jgi:hypothetical protein
MIVGGFQEFCRELLRLMADNPIPGPRQISVAEWEKAFGSEPSQPHNVSIVNPENDHADH